MSHYFFRFNPFAHFCMSIIFETHFQLLISRSLLRSGLFPWQMLGPIAYERCGFQHDIVAPADGFLWDLAWDNPLKCARSPDLWRQFQMVPLGLTYGAINKPGFSGRGEPCCLVRVPRPSPIQFMIECTRGTCFFCVCSQ